MSLYDNMAQRISNPRSVHCTTCHRDEKVNAAWCLQNGWPVCHGETMTIDSHAARCIKEAKRDA